MHRPRTKNPARNCNGITNGNLPVVDLYNNAQVGRGREQVLRDCLCGAYPPTISD